MLSFLNSIFDPLGFLSPVTIAGKILFRETTGIDWDQPLVGSQKFKRTSRKLKISNFFSNQQHQNLRL
jgi:hypothetical protein